MDDEEERGGDYNEEEAWVYHTLNDFDEILKRNGVPFILNNISKESFTKLYTWISSGNWKAEQELCALLNKNASEL
jgi:hypothetical protein